MKTLVLAGKGGTGKSTLAMNLSVDFAQAGRRVAVIDTDPQETVARWRRVRKADNVPVVPGEAADTGRLLQKAEASGYELAIVDTGGQSMNQELGHLLELASLMVLVFRPLPTEYTSAIFMLPSIVDVQRRTGTAFVGVLTQVPIRYRHVLMVRKGFEKLGVPMLESELRFRVGLADSYLHGLAVCEDAPRSKAAFEVRDLRKELAGILWKSDKTRVTA